MTQQTEAHEYWAGIEHKKWVVDTGVHRMYVRARFANGAIQAAKRHLKIAFNAQISVRLAHPIHDLGAKRV